jgi:hypothetical protein
MRRVCIGQESNISQVSLLSKKMPPKKGKKGVKIVTDLSSFNQNQVKKQQEQEFNASKTQAFEQKASAPVEQVNKNEEEVQKF